MSFLRGRRPSPAMLVALVALFVSLSGVSYGVATGFIDSREIKNNEIRSVDIRNNQIRTRDLRNNEVRGIDIRNSTIQGRDVGLNTITGADVKEDTLQKVPSAFLADAAAKATSADSAASVDSLKAIPLTNLAEGAAPVTLATHGPLTVRGRCADTGGGVTEATVEVSSAEDNSAAGGLDGSDTDLDAADGHVTVAVLDDAAAPGRAIALRDVFASAPSGPGLTGQIALYADAAGAAASCSFYGHLAVAG